MKFVLSLLTFAVSGVLTLSAADISNFSTAKRWSAAECTVTQNGNGMTVNMPIDHKAGEKNYPIGWPRLYLYKLTPAEKDWSKAKAISFKFHLEFTGTSTATPINFQIRTKGPQDKKAAGFFFELKEAVNKKTVTITLPLDKVKNLNNVVYHGFFISESKYKHGENLKFTVSDFKLINK